MDTQRKVFLIVTLSLCLAWVAIGLFVFFGYLETIEFPEEDGGSKDEVRLALITTITTTVGIAVAALARCLLPKDSGRDG